MRLLGRLAEGEGVGWVWVVPYCRMFCGIAQGEEFGRLGNVSLPVVWSRWELGAAAGGETHDVSRAEGHG